jgi:hypothetical protein
LINGAFNIIFLQLQEISELPWREVSAAVRNKQTNSRDCFLKSVQ